MLALEFRGDSHYRCCLGWAFPWCIGVYRLVIKTVWIGFISTEVSMLGTIGTANWRSSICIFFFALILDFDDWSVCNTDCSCGIYRV